MFFGMMMRVVYYGMYFLGHFFYFFFFPFPFCLIEVVNRVGYLFTLSVLGYHIHEESPSLSILRWFTELDLLRVSEIGFSMHETLHSLLELLFVLE